MIASRQALAGARPMLIRSSPGSRYFVQHTGRCGLRLPQQIDINQKLRPRFNSLARRNLGKSSLEPRCTIPLYDQIYRSSSSKINEIPAAAVSSVDVSSLSPAAQARHWAGIYAELSKVRLSALVVMTTGAGFMFSGAATTAGVVPFAAAAVGTSLAACSANTFNQVWEKKNDLRMKRTAKR